MSLKTKPHLHADWIDEDAKKIIARLQTDGFTTYLVGGCVRDLLVSVHPKDFDIATSAVPQQVKRRIPASFIIGKRFRLVLVKRGLKQFEVATFRREKREEDLNEDNEAHFNDNIFGTPEEDAKRRDFTMNALFYDPIKNELIDYTTGVADIENRTLRMIGNPAARLIEDPIRILRSLRFSHKLGFTIEPELRAEMINHAHELQRSVLPRKREEFLKLLRLNDPVRAWREMYDLGILKAILPSLLPIYENPEQLEIFESYLQRIAHLVADFADPVELFSSFLLSYIRARFSEEPMNPKLFLEIENDKTLEQLMRHELGMFNLEQSSFLKALELQSQLVNSERFKRKGPKRRSSFLNQLPLNLALRICDFEYQLSAAEKLFWYEQLHTHSRPI